MAHTAIGWGVSGAFHPVVAFPGRALHFSSNIQIIPCQQCTCLLTEGPASGPPKSVLALEMSTALG